MKTFKRVSMFVLAAVACVITACSGGSGTGSLVVNIGGNARAVMPEIDMEPKRLVITGQGPGGSSFTRYINVAEGDQSVTIDRLASGTWQVFVEALNEGGLAVGGGYSEVKIKSGSTAYCTVTVEPFDGYGLLYLEVTWDMDMLSNPYVEAAVSKKGMEPMELVMTTEMDRAETEEILPTGYYTLSVKIYDDLGLGTMSAFYGGTTTMVRIVKDEISGESLHITYSGSVDDEPYDPDSPGFPSPGDPSGTDAISSSTNQSGRENETAPKLNPLAGAAYVQPPQINNYGTVNLGYTMDTPGGRAGMQPQVGLSYSSSGGDGLAGIGWSLGTGLGVISRTTRNGELYYDHRDVFTYNGKRLVKVEGDDDDENGTYRLEIESGFSKFVLSEAENGGIWRVYDKAGTVTIFGEDRNSRIYRPDDESRTYIWNFTRSIDLNGNYMYALYDTSEYDDKHILYLQEIRYTGNIRENTPARQWVRFEYKERDDEYVSKAPGFIMSMDRMLDRVVVGWDAPGFLGGGETELWDYEMVYEESEDSHRPLLMTVESSRNTTKPAFHYQEAQHLFTWQKVANPRYNEAEENPDATKFFEGDFNGDGISDMVFFNPETGYWRAAQGRREGGYTFPVYGNRFQGYDSDKKIQFFKGNVTGDYNGDGRSDIAFYLPETREFWVAEHNGSVFSFKNYGRQSITSLDIFACDWFPGDYDGNGLSDTVLFNEATGDWILMRNLGGRFEFTKFSQHFQNLFRDDYRPNSNLDSTYTADASDYGQDRGKVYFLNGDYNGDGRTDISLYDSRTGNWWVGENYRKEGSSSAVQFEVKWKLYKVFTAPEQALFGHDRFSGDFNGDGLSDFLLFDRETARWWIGETGNGTINFRIYSRAPQFKDITRWLQGDFNGDGRTDIGFYSKTDNNFWIGEATPDGFRYRIYNNLSYGPDPDEVLATPLPKDEVKIEKGEAFATEGESLTRLVTYDYDHNIYEGRGEKVFVGHFTGNAAPEMLIYRMNYSDDLNIGWRMKSVSDSATEESDDISGNSMELDPTQESVRILNQGSVYRYTPTKDGILYHTVSSGTHYFNVIGNDGAWNDSIRLGAFSSTTISNFSIDQSLYFIDYFENSNIKSLFVLGNESDSNPVFYNVEDSTVTNYEIVYNGSTLSQEQFRTLMRDYGNYKNNLAFVSGTFTGNATEILFVDMRESTHRWFLGAIDSVYKRVTFTDIMQSSSTLFAKQGYGGIFRIVSDEYNNHALVTVTQSSSGFQFHRFVITTGNVTRNSSTVYSSVTFTGSFDHENRPIVKTSTGYSTINTWSFAMTAINFTNNTGFEAAEIKRPELMTHISTYNWIQGDYNGDGKTDIGIFRLRDRTWYFALTQGTVPDMVDRVDNGIGGRYYFEYINSSTLDNTGDDNIPDLPMNYKVCSKLTVEDGQGNRVVTRYGYADGYAFSAFINGYKETDYFGFTTFTVTDALGGKNTSTYHNVPYSDFRMNRALAGAVKENWFIGYDQKEYSRTKYEYTLHEIIPPNPPESPLNPPGGDLKSFLVEPVKVEKYIKGTLTETRRSNIVLTDGEYAMESKTESVTDHYSDGVHEPVTVSSYSEFENIDETNEMRLTTKIDFLDSDHEVTSTYRYESRGNLEREVKSYTGGTLQKPADIIMAYEYDSYGNRIKEQNRSGSPWRETLIEYDEALKQYVTARTARSAERDLTTAYHINYSSAFGGISAVVDPNGNATLFEYDDYGRLARQRANTDSGVRTLNEYSYSTTFPLRGTFTRFTGTADPAVEMSAYVDGMGRTIHTVQGYTDGESGDAHYTKTGRLVYDALGRLVRKSQTSWGAAAEMTNFAANTREKYPTINDYDASGRTKKVTLPADPGDEGRETSITFTFNDPWETVETHSVGRSKRTVKNARGQVLYVEDYGTGDPSTSSGTGSTGSGTGEFVSARMGFAYDLAGNRVKKMDLPSTSSGTGSTGSGTGDMDVSVTGSLFQVGEKDTSGNNIAQWQYDGFGRVISSSDPDLEYTGITYTAYGETAAVTDARGWITTMAYDGFGRLIEKRVPDFENPAQKKVVRYLYDEMQGCENALGRLVAIDDPAQRKEFSYDRMGRVKKEVREIRREDLNPGPSPAGRGEVFVTRFEHDLLNRNKRISYPRDPKSNRSMTALYTYSAFGATSLKVDNGSDVKEIITSIEYNEFGQMTEVRRGNNTTTTYTYDVRGRLDNLSSVSSANNRILALQDVSYRFRVDNSIRSVTNSTDIDTDGANTSTIRYDYTYDGLNRLKTASGSYLKTSTDQLTTLANRTYTHSYSYAANGNLMSKTMYDSEGLYGPVATGPDTDTWTYDYANHAATSIDTTAQGSERFTMEYDASGNMIHQHDAQKSKSKTMDYDASNRIRKVTDGTNQVVGEYYYDDQGFRVRKVSRRTVAGEDRQIEVLYPSMYFGIEKQYTAGGAEIEESHCAVNNVYLNGVRVAVVAPSGQALYYLTDQVDSVKVVVNDSGLPIKRFEYLPYGETWFEEGEGSHAPKYNSQELDLETGYYFYNARHYDPEISRFVTADNVIDGEFDTQGWNRYSYTKGNPIIYKDPSGHLVQELMNYFKTGEYVDDKTKEWGNSQEQNIEKNFLRDTRLTTEKKVAEMEARGLKTDRIEKRLTDLRGKYNCNGTLSVADKTVLDQYKETIAVKEESSAGSIVKPIANSRITQSYTNGHKALDISNGEVGATVVSSKAGVVDDIRYQAGYYDKKGIAQPGGGRIVVVKNTDDTYSYYMHLQKDSTVIEKGQKIAAGTKIGNMGNSGNETVDMLAHLHYEERDGNNQSLRPRDVENHYK